jgi:outer membrane lipoprotein-sorting protein
MRPAEKIKKLFIKSKVTVSSEFDDIIMNNALTVYEKSKARESAQLQPSIWRIIMKSPVTKIAVAAGVMIAIFIGIKQFVGPIYVATPAFAEIVQPLLDAENGTFKMTINVRNSGLDWINCGNEPVQTIKVTFSGPSRTRWDVPTGEVLVANMQYGKVMILKPDPKEAVVMQISPPGLIPPHNRFNKVFELKRLIQYALNAQGDCVKFIGEKEINGTIAVGYQITGPPHGQGGLTVWADAKTKLPIRIEQSVGTETAVVSDINYNIEPNESLFSVEPPNGYSVVVPDEQPKFVVNGTVKDAATGQPIVGAKVSDDGYGTKPYKGAITDSDGRYRYLTWPEEHNIKAEAAGYKPQNKVITGLFHAESANEKVIDFALKRE